ncbi:MAG: NADH-quinone oxidoreductase subunit NuoE, partial [Pseudomonadota bacterium]
MLRRLHPDQPESFAFTPENQAWAEAQITKYPEGRQASAVIPLLWRAQEQEGWLTRPAMEYVAAMLDMAYIRVLEVATFYFMFQLQPVGSVAHFQVCGTTSCMIMGAEDLVGVCKEKIAKAAHALSEDGRFSWEEVECLGACSNAPMVQIGKDYYEDLTVSRFSEIIDELAEGKVPLPGPQTGRFAAEPASGLTTLSRHDGPRPAHNASVALAADIGDTVKRIDGTEVPLRAPWRKDEPPVGDSPHPDEPPPAVVPGTSPEPGSPQPPSDMGDHERPDDAEATGVKPATLGSARGGAPDNLKDIKGVGPKLEALLHRLGFYHFDQIAGWNADEVAWVDRNLEGFKGRVS